MKTKGCISKKVETKVREYFEKINNDVKQCNVGTANNSSKPQANK